MISVVQGRGIIEIMEIRAAVCFLSIGLLSAFHVKVVEERGQRGTNVAQGKYLKWSRPQASTFNFHYHKHFFFTIPEVLQGVHARFKSLSWSPEHIFELVRRFKFTVSFKLPTLTFSFLHRTAYNKNTIQEGQFTLAMISLQPLQARLWFR